jgi:hypothetical protein
MPDPRFIEGTRFTRGLTNIVLDWVREGVIDVSKVDFELTAIHLAVFGAGWINLNGDPRYMYREYEGVPRDD